MGMKWAHTHIITHTQTQVKVNQDFGGAAGGPPCRVFNAVTCRLTGKDKERLFSVPDSCNRTSLPNGGRLYLAWKEGWDTRSSVGFWDTTGTSHPHGNPLNKGDVWWSFQSQPHQRALKNTSFHCGWTFDSEFDTDQNVYKYGMIPWV